MNKRSESHMKILHICSFFYYYTAKFSLRQIDN